jgi:hypothetical protein
VDLLEQNAGKAQACYTLARVTQGDDCVVVIVDARDPQGESFARWHYGDEETDKALERGRRLRKIPTAIVA